MGQLVTMPNGEVVEVDDNITPDALKRIKSQYTPSTRAGKVMAGQPRKAPPTEEEKEVQRRIDVRKQYESDSYLPAWMRGQSDAQTGANKGLFANFGDEIGAGANALLFGIPSAIAHGDVGRIGREYRVSRNVQRQLDREAQDRSPVATTLGEIGGAVANPLGAGEKVVAGAANLAGRVGLNRAAGALGNVSERIAAAGALPRAVLAGGNQGALNAAGEAENLSDVPSAVLNGYGVGGITGGVLGGATHLGTRAVQTIVDAMPENASRKAYERIASLLDSGGMTAKKARDEIEMTDIMGGNAMVQDLTPGLRAQAAAISRKPGVPSSNELIERGEARIQDRRGRFGQAVRDETALPVGGDDALARADTLAATRKAQGQADYAEGGAMDEPLQWSEDLDKFFRTAPENTNASLRGAYDDMLARRESPQGFNVEKGAWDEVPNLRTLDYMKRRFDSDIGAALKAGDKAKAQALSSELGTIKGLLGEANPQYREILAAQRDLYQKQNALEIGSSVLSRIGTKPREVMKELRALPEHALQDARIGIIDALINADNKADPVAYFKSIMRNNAQKEVLEFAFGGRGNLGRFERWVNREVRSTRADVLTAPGRQSETSRIMMGADDEAGGITNVLGNAMRGYAFGGSVGALSGVSRTLQNIATGTSKFAQEEIAKILMSKGENLVKGTEAAAAYKKARDRGNRRRAVAVAKGGQQLFTGIAGGQ